MACGPKVTPDARRGRRKWVWWSTPRSVARHRVSVLALVETLGAMSAYVALALHYERQWVLLASACVAPLLLLRSRQSVAAGVAWLRRDLRIQSSFPEPGKWNPAEVSMAVSLAIGLGVLTFVFARDSLDTVEAPGARVLLTVLLVTVPWTFGTFIVQATCIALVQMSSQRRDQCLVIGITAAFVGVVSGAATRSAWVSVGVALVSVLLASHWLNLLRPSGGPSSIRSLAVMAALAIAQVGCAAGLLVAYAGRHDALSVFLCASGIWFALGQLASLAMHLERPDAERDVDLFRRAVGTRVQVWLWSTPGGAFGYWLRTLAVRAVSTLRYPRAGWHSLPGNWRDNLVVIDLRHPPEVVPRVGRVHPSYSASGAWRIITSTDSHWLRKLVVPITLLVEYLGLLYRWSLKSTLWLWWPVVILSVPPFHRLTPEGTRVRTSEGVRGPVAHAKVWIAFAVVIWLLLFPLQHHQSVAKALPTIGGLVEFMLKFAPPDFGVRWLALFATAALSIVVWHQAARLTAAFEDPLKTPEKFAALSGEPLQIFMARATRIERLRLAWTCCGLILAYSTALWLAAAWYPDTVRRFVPEELLAHL